MGRGGIQSVVMKQNGERQDPSALFAPRCFVLIRRSLLHPGNPVRFVFVSALLLSGRGFLNPPTPPLCFPPRWFYLVWFVLFRNPFHVCFPRCLFYLVGVA